MQKYNILIFLDKYVVTYLYDILGAPINRKLGKALFSWVNLDFGATVPYSFLFGK